VSTPEHGRLEEIFNTAVAIDSPAEREAFLDSTCGDDPRLRKKVIDLLKANEMAGIFLETPPVTPADVFEPEPAGTRIGRYKILQMIGEGGFGTVYMAEQEEPVSRRVALKIIKLGMDTKQVIARFEVERQALAMMDHPNIAKVLDAGATETGRPYFVMELVKGVTITEYCEHNSLSMQERLQLVLPICHAVQHAHQKGIIHRDLKPSNVLVAFDEDQAVPKVIDFGIAKATSRKLTEKTFFTEFRQFIGTPEYMSPDQAEVSGLEMDTRTDVYSLGVLMYVLLTGTTPFNAKMLRETSYEEIRRIIREVEPPKPSTRLLSLQDASMNAGSMRPSGIEPRALARLVRGDLDWIAMKAMEKDRTRRYATAKDLADDIERYLKHEPVTAGPPGMAYKFRKFVRRHRAGVLAGTLVALALLVGLSLALLSLIQISKARSQIETERNLAERARANAQEHSRLAEVSAYHARQQAARSETVSQFLETMLRSVDPSQAQGREMTIRFVLDEAVEKIDEGELSEQPEVEAAVRLTLGETYKAIGLYDAAEVNLRAAEALRSRWLGDEHPDTLYADRALAELLRVKGRFAEAEALLRETAATQRRVLGEEHAETLATQNELALALWGPGRFEEAESIHRQTLAIQRRVLGDEDAATAVSMGYLGVDCRALGKIDEAESLLREALERCRRLLGEDHPSTAEALNNLGHLREDQGERGEAEILYRRTYELYCRILGPDHPQTLIPLNNLLRVLIAQGKNEAIRPLAAERIAHLERVAHRPEASASALHACAWELLNCEVRDLRNPAAALPVALQAVELDGGRDATTLETLALAYGLTGKLDQAIATQRQAVAVAQAGGLYDRRRMEARLRDFLLQRGNVAEAFNVTFEQLALGLDDWVQSRFVPDMVLITQSESLIEEGHYDEAAAVLRGCLAMRRKALPPGHWLLADIKSRLGGAIALDGRFVEAEPLLLEACTTLETSPPIATNYRRQAVERIIRLYESWEKPNLAAPWRQRLEAGDDLNATGGDPAEE